MSTQFWIGLIIGMPLGVFCLLLGEWIGRG